jgi:hypothetical protein
VTTITHIADLTDPEVGGQVEQAGITYQVIARIPGVAYLVAPNGEVCATRMNTKGAWGMIRWEAPARSQADYAARVYE